MKTRISRSEPLGAALCCLLFLALPLSSTAFQALTISQHIPSKHVSKCSLARSTGGGGGRNQGQYNNKKSRSNGGDYSDGDPFGDYEDDGWEESYYDGEDEGEDDTEDGYYYAYDDEPSSTFGGNRNAVSPESDPKSTFFSRKSLTDPLFVMRESDDGDNETFQRLCDGAGITQPSRIQALAWPVLLQGKAAIVADQTGSGKTLAYLLPLIQRMRASNKAEKGSPNMNGSPKVLILTPTAELADQVREVCGKLSQSVPFRTFVTTATGKYSTSIREQIRTLQNQRVDVLVSTPGRVATILRTKNSGLDLTNLQAIVPVSYTHLTLPTILRV